MLHKSNPKFVVLHVYLYMQMKYVLHVFLIHAVTGEARISPTNVEKIISVISLSQVSQRL